MIEKDVDKRIKSVTESERIAELEEAIEKEKVSHAEDVRVLTEEIAELMGKIREMAERIAYLESQLNNNSSNSSLPPTADKIKGEKRANQYNGRERSGKKTGGQTGHKGRTLTKAEVEEKLTSGEYRHEVIEIGEKREGPYITKYELDLEVTPVIREIRIYGDGEGKMTIPERYYSDVTYGDTIKGLTIALYSEGVSSNDRIAAFLNEMSGVNLGLSEGSVYNFCAQFAGKAKEVIAEIEQEQSRENILCTDATCTSTNGKRSYIRNISSSAAVVYYAMESKSVSALEKIDLLVNYHGILVHDHESAMYHFGTDHAECNVHILRYLRKNTEDTGNQWSGRMIELLREMNTARKALTAKGEEAFTAEDKQEYENQYRQIIEEGRKENQNTEYEYAKKKESALLNRMEKYRANHLLFLYRFDVPFDDNMSERDLRKAKNRQKMAGGFRKHSGLEMYCKILTIIETAKRRGSGIIDTCKKIFSGNPTVFQAV